MSTTTATRPTLTPTPAQVDLLNARLDRMTAVVRDLRQRVDALVAEEDQR